eukprot:GFYU01001019.1.p1 GENE.GFYU01001019.1~~GFYU01001019.1.p1  ORF type:complete len:1000 (+),score=301.16 GFYU01001019.1:262-3261(+)
MQGSKELLERPGAQSEHVSWHASADLGGSGDARGRGTTRGDSQISTMTDFTHFTHLEGLSPDEEDFQDDNAPRGETHTFMKMFTSKFSIRNLLVLMFALQLAITTIAIWMSWYIEAKNSVSEIAAQYVTQSTRRTVEETLVFLREPVSGVNEIKRAWLLNYLGFSAADNRPDQYLVRTLQANRQHFTYAYIAAEQDGQWLGCSRTDDGSFAISAGSVSKGFPKWGITAEDKRDTNNEISFTAAGAWDPRTRDWYIAAKNSNSTDTLYTDVYEFTNTKNWGFTAFSGSFDANGNLEYAFGGDVTLDNLNSFLQKEKPLPESEAYIMECSPGEHFGAIVGSSAGQTSNREGDHLVRVKATNANNGLIQDSAKRLLESGACPSQNLEEKGDDLWIWSQKHDIPGLNWIAVVVVPNSALFEGLQTNSLLTIYIAAGIFVVSVLVATFFALRITSPLKKLRSHLDKIAKAEMGEGVQGGLAGETRPESVDSFSMGKGQFSEIQKVVNSQKRALAALKTLRQRNGFLRSQNMELKKAMRALEKRTRSPIPTRCLTIFTGTWNLGNAAPPQSLRSWLPANHDIYAVGCQEGMFGKGSEETFFSTVGSTIGPEYERVVGVSIVDDGIDMANLGGIRMVVYIRKMHIPYVNDIETNKVNTGLGQVIWNKGGVKCSFRLYDMSVCFVSTHLAAHQGKTLDRNKNVYDIMRGLVSKAGLDIDHQHHHVFWVGDLNYRIDIPRDETIALVQQQNWDQLLTADQLLIEKRAGRVFSAFTEAPIAFAPTFKVERKPGTVFESKKMRIPSWCDRVLWRSFPGCEADIVSYFADPSISTSDHKPVGAVFSVNLRLPYISPQPASMAEVVLTDLFVELLEPEELALTDPKVQADAAKGKTRTPSIVAQPTGEDVVYVEIDSEILDMTLRSPSWYLNEQLEAKVLLDVNVSDFNYLETQHLTISVVSRVRGKRVGAAVISMADCSSGSPNFFAGELHQHGLNTGSIRGNIIIRTPEQ